MKIDDQLAERFRCAKCNHRGGDARRFAATGTGLSKLLDIQHRKYLGVSCRNCGYTEIYDPSMLEGKSRLGDVLDVIFGG